MKRVLFWLLIYVLLVGNLYGAKLFDSTYGVLEKGIQDSILRQKIIAYNLANADNPNFVPIRFDDELTEIMARPGFIKDEVITEEEMAKMTKNRFRHQAMIRLMNMKIETLRRVVNQGR